MSDSLISAMRRCGAFLAESSSRQTEAAGGPFYGTVAGKSGAKLKVNAKGASLLLPMTTACTSAKDGDRCIIEMIGPQAIVTGILAK